MPGAVPAAQIQRWAVSPLARLTWRSWDGDYVAFESRSGQLAEFSVLAAAAMACLEEAPRTADELAAMLAADLGQRADAEFVEAVGHTVEQFRRLGWVVAA